MNEDILPLLKIAADLTRKNPDGAREILCKEPKWAYTIFHALLLAGIITPEDAEKIINGEPFVPPEPQLAAPAAAQNMSGGTNLQLPIGLTEENKELIRRALSLTEEDISKFSAEEQRNFKLIRQQFMNMK